jgi:hypothetical protein
MRLLNLPQACVLLIAAQLSAGVVATSYNEPQTHRMLRAATKRADLYRRSMRISKKFESEFVYAQGKHK